MLVTIEQIMLEKFAHRKGRLCQYASVDRGSSVTCMFCYMYVLQQGECFNVFRSYVIRTNKTHTFYINVLT
jgi:hypothetical protein